MMHLQHNSGLAISLWAVLLTDWQAPVMA